MRVRAQFVGLLRWYLSSERHHKKRNTLTAYWMSGLSTAQLFNLASLDPAHCAMTHSRPYFQAPATTPGAFMGALAINSLALSDSWRVHSFNRFVSSLDAPIMACIDSKCFFWCSSSIPTDVWIRLTRSRFCGQQPGLFSLCVSLSSKMNNSGVPPLHMTVGSSRIFSSLLGA